jgi:hypothetical protein
MLGAVTAGYNGLVANATLEPLAILVGTWTVELSFPTDPPGTVTGQASFAWLDDGDFLVMRTGTKGAGPPWSTCVIGRDDATPTFTALYFDDRGVSRIYQMSMNGREWRQWRDAPGFAQRFIGTVSADGNSIVARWEKSMDGTTWEHDFNLRYSRR